MIFFISLAPLPKVGIRDLLPRQLRTFLTGPSAYLAQCQAPLGVQRLLNGEIIQYFFLLVPLISIHTCLCKGAPGICKKF